ncbi:MAG: glycosyltransferase family 2 protein, partial [Clostridia bacterium]|nr:glycosyltransferase family 2 protein [Clostridia bacterium]
NNIKAFHDACKAAFDGKIESYELIFVNDGSTDETWKNLTELCRTSEINMKIINFSRNFGKEAAMYAGLQKAEGDFVTLIDADLQQRPEIAIEMVEFLENNPDYDSVAAYQEQRREGFVLSFFKTMFYKIINRMCDIDFKQGASDFRTFRHSVVEAILNVPEYHRFSKGIFSWVGFNTYYIPYVAQERNAGNTTWSFKKLFKYALEGIIAYSTLPLRISSIVGILMSFIGALYMIVVVIQKLTFGIAIPGYPTTIVLILFIGGLQLTSLGIIGEYISRIYIESKRRPICIIKNYETNEESK